MLKLDRSSVLSLVPRRGEDDTPPQPAPASGERYTTVLLLDEEQLDRLLERRGGRAMASSPQREPTPLLAAARPPDAMITAEPIEASTPRTPRPPWLLGGLLAATCVGGVGVWLWTHAPDAATPAAGTVSAVEPTPDVAPVVVTGPSFSVDASTFLDDVAAEAAALRLARTGWPAFTWQLEEGRRHVLVGPYVSIAEAEASQRLLAQAGFPAARLHVDDRLRVTLVGAPAGPVHARYPDVRLVAAPGRLSYVIELADEPRSVSGQRAGPTSFVVLATPLSTPVERQAWKAPGDVRLVSRVALAPHILDASLLQVVVTLAETADAAVRLEGRRIYIDVARRVDEVAPIDAAPLVQAPGARGRAESSTGVSAHAAAAPAPLPAAALPAPVEVPHRGVIPGPVASVERPATGAGGALDDVAAYRAAVQPVVARFDEIQPFLRSAIATATPDVLAALSGTCGEVEQALAAVVAPPSARAVHGLLLSAAQLARAAASPAYAGDRTGQVREASAQLAAAKARLTELVRPMVPPR
jgi:hypothetical protein